jgi:hypothetical protein
MAALRSQGRGTEGCPSVILGCPVPRRAIPGFDCPSVRLSRLHLWDYTLFMGCGSWTPGMRWLPVSGFLDSEVDELRHSPGMSRTGETLLCRVQGRVGSTSGWPSSTRTLPAKSRFSLIAEHDVHMTGGGNAIELNGVELGALCYVGNGGGGATLTQFLRDYGQGVCGDLRFGSWSMWPTKRIL